MTDPTAHALRRRAVALRRLADDAARSGALALEPLAGPETWHGPRVERCLLDLRSACAVVVAEIEQLRLVALRLDWQATELEREAAATRWWVAS